jgi:hypothetical protein
MFLESGAGISGLSGEDLPSMWIGIILAAGDMGGTGREKNGKFLLSLLDLGLPFSSALGFQNFSVPWASGLTAITAQSLGLLALD